jgi:hypothetical protein
MDDWFSVLVGELLDEIIQSPETSARLSASGRVSPESLKRAGMGSVDDLRRQYAREIAAIQRVRERIEEEEHLALAKEWRAVMLADRRILLPGMEPRGLERLRRRKDPAEALQAYEAAKVSKNVGELPVFHSLEAERARMVHALSERVRTAVLLTLNGAIDAAIEASYGRGFSYTEPAILTDPLAVSANPVNTAAYRRVAYLVENVGSATIGVAGPRGSGKSTLMSRFAATVLVNNQPQQWGVYVPAPVKYDPRDFLLYMFAQLCVQVLGPERASRVEERLTNSGPTPAARSLTRLLLLAAAATMTCGGLVIALRTAYPHAPSHRVTDLSIAGSCAVIALMSAFAAAADALGFRVFVIRVLIRSRGSGFIPAYTRALMMIAALTGVAAVTLFGLLASRVVPDPGYVAAAGLAAGGIAGLVVVRPQGRMLYAQPGYLDEAERWYAKVKFQQSYTTGWSGTITAGTQALPFPVLAQGGTSGGTAVTPLAMSTPEIIGALKSFTATLAYPDGPTRVPVIIGIDEVDKISDPQEAQSFLNQIKGLFGDSNCLFLVSISDDALASFERRGVPVRDAFDSSLSSVVTLSYLSRAEARTLTGQRLAGVEEPVADLLFTLSGGLARDLVRLIRRAVEAREGGATGLDALACVLIAADVEAKQAAVLARAANPDSCAAHLTLLTWAGTRYDSDPDLTRLHVQARSLLDSACHDATAAPCPAAETGAYCLWLATVGQVFMTCSSRDDFLRGESSGDFSFERLAEARRNFTLGPDYVLTAIDSIRETWKLSDPPA